MKFVSTRNAKLELSGSEAIVKGISDDGGLFVPSSFPKIDSALMQQLLEMSYEERAAKILSMYLDDFSYEELLEYTTRAYSRFDGDPAPVVKIEDGLFMLELWHGPTCAFKDMALTLLPYLLVASKLKLGKKEKTLILVATSGDTGKAALEGFKDVDGTEIIVFYPGTGVSAMQRKQMVTQEGNNVHVAGIVGNFDDAQTSVKKIFNDSEVKEYLASKGVAMSSANSINFGRLAPQIAYYISSYLDLVNSGEIKMGDKVNFVVPTGNFGNILAGYYAERMGLPVNKLIIASNANNILTDFFNTGIYDVNRDFYKTASPSMDILVSSNLERFIFEILGRDSEKVKSLYDSLKATGKFEIDQKLLDDSIFVAGWADEEETKDAINTFFDIDDYIMDTHTAVGASVYNDYSCELEDETPTIIVSTASPYKFAPDVLAAIGGKEKDPFKALSKLQNATALECPENLLFLKDKEEKHTLVIDRTETKQAVYDFINK
ncbi:MAG: threonine synthase [Clostridia bacterium]|nr:threonine synthase [Clostridia bacterium]